MYCCLGQTQAQKPGIGEKYKLITSSLMRQPYYNKFIRLLQKDMAIYLNNIFGYYWIKYLIEECLRIKGWNFLPEYQLDEIWQGKTGSGETLARKTFNLFLANDSQQGISMDFSTAWLGI